jgi:protoporphyrinogen/coproporphyrinogen III oxidase
MAARVRRVAVIGGGITGLAAAFRLREIAAAREIPLEVTLFESGTRIGGALDTIRRDGFVIETGADSFLSEKPAAVKLAERLGLSHELIGTQEQFRKTYVVRAGRLVEIPEGFSLLAPTFFGPLLKSRLFSPWGKLRIMMEPLIPRRRDESDESLAAFVTRRLGRETLVRVAQPLAGGIYTADPERLSVGATMPRFVEMEQRHGSVIRGLRAAARTRSAQARGVSGARWSLFLSFKGGMRTLVDALAARLEGCIRYGAEVVSLARNNGGVSDDGRAWTVGVADSAAFEAHAVVCAAPAYAAATLIRPHNEKLASLLASIGYASAATVNMAFHSDFPQMSRSFGFVVPVAEHRKIIAGSFSSLKFAGRAPERMILARVFLGGALQSEMMKLGDDAMLAAAREEFAGLLGVTEEPVFAYVQRWPASMPQFAVGHLERVAEIEREAAGVPGFALAGAFLRGVGIPDCIRSGEEAAESAIARLTSGK